MCLFWFSLQLLSETVLILRRTERDNIINVRAGFFMYSPLILWAGELSRYSDWATGWTVRASNPVRGEIFRTCPDRPWGPPSLLYNGYWVFPGVKERPGCDADHSPLLVPWSRKSRAIPLLPIWSVRPVQSLSVCTREHFTWMKIVTVAAELFHAKGRTGGQTDMTKLILTFRNFFESA